MKKTAALILALLSLLLPSCSASTSSASETAETTAEQNSTAETTDSDTSETTETEAPDETEEPTLEQIKQQLTDAGFPDDYATPLAELKLKYPSWTFNPINITELSGGKYTWEYVIAAETEDDENNTVYSTMEDALDYSIDATPVESGIWYRAKVETVEFFMDPRNFLDKKYIFMFENLGNKQGDKTRAVDHLLYGTFMFQTVIPDEGNEKTYAQWISEVGQQLGISPLMLAARLRQEQGVSGDSKMITGKTGDVLWDYYQNGTDNAPAEGFTKEELEAYNGYYNYFNIDATGKGYFNVFLAGMKEAQKHGWTSACLAIKGGAEKVKSRYIDDYQQTLYFQKFNVDARSGRNFWGQYMQGVDAAYSEAGSTYTALVRASMLKGEFTFDIPVYEGMPENPCPDPGSRYSD